MSAVAALMKAFVSSFLIGLAVGVAFGVLVRLCRFITSSASD